MESYEDNHDKESYKSYLMYERLLNDIKYYYDHNLDADGYSKVLGEYFTRYNTKNKGEEIMYALSIVPKVDIMTCRFMKKETVIFISIDLFFRTVERK